MHVNRNALQVDQERIELLNHLTSEPVCYVIPNVFMNCGVFSLKLNEVQSLGVEKLRSIYANAGTTDKA